MAANKREILLASYTLTPAELQHARLVLGRMHPEADESFVVPLAVSVALNSPLPEDEPPVPGIPAEPIYKKYKASKASKVPPAPTTVEALERTYGPLCNHLAGKARKSYGLSHEDYLDLLQLLLLKLIQIDPESWPHNKLIRTILYNYLRDWIKSYKCREKRAACTTSLKPTMAAANTTGKRAEATQLADKLIATLPEVQQNLVKLYFGIEGTPLETWVADCT